MKHFGDLDVYKSIGDTLAWVCMNIPFLKDANWSFVWVVLAFVHYV